MEKDKTIVFMEFSSAGEANIIKGYLESNGIDCFLSNENSPFTGGILTDSLYGVRLNIMEDDLDKAEELMKSMELNADTEEGEETGSNE